MKAILKTLAFSFLIIVAGLSAAPGKTLRILVYPFENIGPAEYSWLSAGMTDSVISDLRKIKGVSVVSDEERRRALGEIELEMRGSFDARAGSRVGILTGADLVFTGNYVVLGGRMRVLCKLIKVETGVIEKGAQIDGRVEDIFDIQGRIVASLMAEAGKKGFAGVTGLTDADRVRLKSDRRPSLEAYRFYSMGLGLVDREPARALEYFKQALSVSADYAEALREAGYTAGAVLNRFDEGTGYLEKARRATKSRTEDDPALYGDILVKQGLVWSARGEQKRALALYNNARRHYEKYKMLTGADYATVAVNRGMAYSRHGRLEEALKEYEAARSIMEQQELKYTVEYAVLLGNIGVVHSKREALDDSLRLALQAKAVRDHLRLQNTPAYAVLLDNIGSVYSKQGRYDLALEQRFRSRDIRDRLGMKNTDGYAVLLSNIAADLTKKADFASARRYYNESRSIRDRLGMGKTYGYAILLSNIGYLYMKAGDVNRALEHYLQSAKLFESLDSAGTVNYGILLFNMAEAYEKRGDVSGALDHYRRALKIFKKEKYKGFRKDEAENGIRRLDEKAGKP